MTANHGHWPCPGLVGASEATGERSGARCSILIDALMSAEADAPVCAA